MAVRRTTNVYFALVIDVSQASFSGGAATPQAPPLSDIFGPSIQTDLPGVILASEDGPYGAIRNLGGPSIAPGLYIDGIVCHREDWLEMGILHLYVC